MNRGVGPSMEDEGSEDVDCAGMDIEVDPIHAHATM